MTSGEVRFGYFFFFSGSPVSFSNCNRWFPECEFIRSQAVRLGRVTVREHVSNMRGGFGDTYDTCCTGLYLVSSF